jgi:hypothetical protein
MSDKYDQLQERYHDFTKALEDYVVSSIPLLKAAEVLARIFYNFGNPGNQVTPWDLIEDEQKQYYIQRAIEELKK